MSFKVLDAGGPALPKMYDIASEVYYYFYGLGYEIDIIYGTTNSPDHNNRRCLDFMSAHADVLPSGATISPEKSMQLGTMIADYCWQHRERFGLNWEIWNRRIRRYQNTDRVKNVWAPYTGASSHTDHVHIECDASPYRPATPPPPATESSGVPIMAMENTSTIKGYQSWADAVKGANHLRWKTVEDKGRYSLWVGPTPGIDFTCDVAIGNLGDGRARLYIERIDWDIKAGTWKSDAIFTPGVIVHDTSGTWEGQITFRDPDGVPKHKTAGHDYRIRVGLETPVPVRYRMRTKGWGIKP